MTIEVLDSCDFGGEMYHAAAVYDDVSGEILFVHYIANEGPRIIDDQDELPPQVALKFGLQESDVSPSIGASDPFGSNGDVSALSVDNSELDSGFFPQDEIDKALSIKAIWGVGNNAMDSSNVRHTNNGRLACAWAVNRISKLTFGKPIGGNLATANMVKVLRKSHISRAEATPGSVIISPTAWPGGVRNTGHVGIIGPGNKIYSNSSSNARWEQNFTMDSWLKYYKKNKGLTLEIFALDRRLYPIPGNFM